MDHLTQEQAYLAMFAFLVDRYGETQSGDIGALLSEIALTSDGKPRLYRIKFLNLPTWSDIRARTNDRFRVDLG